MFLFTVQATWSLCCPYDANSPTRRRLNCWFESRWRSLCIKFWQQLGIGLLYFLRAKAATAFSAS